MMRRVEAKDLVKGLLVVDIEGNKGVILNCDDLHNVHVIFEGEGILINVEPFECGGSAYYCFIEGCEDNSEETDSLFF